MASTSWYGEAIRQRAAAQQERRAGGGGAVIDALLAEAEPLDVHEQQVCEAAGDRGASRDCSQSSGSR